MKTTYYKTADGYAAVTNQCPRGFKGSLYVGKVGPLDNITETAFSPQQLCKMTPVDLADVDPEWVEAFGYDQVQDELEEDELVLLDEEGENLVALVPISRFVTPEPDTGSLRFWYDLGLILGSLLALRLMFS